MQIASDLSTPALVGVLAGYKLLQDATDEIPDGFVDLLFSNLGTLALSLFIGWALYMTNKAQRKKLDELQQAIIDDLKDQLEQVKGERDELLHQLLPDETPRPARRRPQ